MRSQDKKDLIKATSVCITKEDYDKIEIFVNGCLVGFYKSKERALEVLDEIQKLLNPMLVFKNCNCTQEMLDNIKEAGAWAVSDNAHIEQAQTCIYEMPSE